MGSTGSATRADLHLMPFATRHLFRPLALLLVEFAAYLLCVTIAVTSPTMALKLVAGVAAGVLTATLAIIGHDCAHRGGTRSQALNRTKTCLPRWRIEFSSSYCL